MTLKKSSKYLLSDFWTVSQMLHLDHKQTFEKD